MNELPASCAVLLVEDDLLIAMDVEALLKDAGCTVVGPLTSVKAALEVIPTQLIDAALLDVNLKNELVFPVADTLARLEVPFVFVTSCSLASIPWQYRERPLVRKPYEPRQLIATLAQVLN